MRALAVIVAVLVGGAAGFWARGGAVGPPVARPPAPQAEGASIMRCGGGVTIDEVRALLDERLPLEGSPSSGPPPAAAPAAVRAAESVAAVQAAMNDGAWSEDDRELLRGALGHVPAPEADALLTELFTAINAGRVRVDAIPVL